MDSKSYNTNTGCCDYEFGFAVVGETYPSDNFEKKNISEINQEILKDSTGKKFIDVTLPYFMPKDLTISGKTDKSKVPLVYFENEGIAEIGKTAKGFLMMVVNHKTSDKLHIYNNSGDIVCFQGMMMMRIKKQQYFFTHLTLKMEIRVPFIQTLEI